LSGSYARGSADSFGPAPRALFDADHTEGTYAAAEALRACFERVVIVTPDVQMVTRQGILRRIAEQRIEVITLGRAAPERCLCRGADRDR
jgi:hypothetical protein